MKIGVLGYIHSGDQNTVRIAQTLALQQHSVEMFSFSDPNVINTISKKKFDFLLVTMGREFDHEPLRALRDRMFLVQWIPDEYGPGDAPGGLWFDKIKGIYNLLMVETKGIVEALKPFADHAEWVPQYFDNLYHASPTNRTNFEYDLIFMGGTNSAQSSIRMEFLNRLQKKYNIGIFGLEHGNALVNGGMTAAYRKAKIGLNFINDKLPQYELGYSNRVMKTIGSGCFLLTHRIPGMSAVLQSGTHYADYSSLDYDDLVTKIDYYLSNGRERERIAANGCSYVLKNYNVAKIVEGFVDLIQKDRASV